MHFSSHNILFRTFNFDLCPVTIHSRETCVSHYGKEVTNMEDVAIRDLVEKYLQNLAQQGYCRSSIKNYKVFCRQLIRYF